MTRPSKVVHVTSVHPPLDTRIFWKECRTLAKAGYEVVLIAPDPPAAERDGVRFVGHRRPASRLERVLRTPWRLLRAARREKGDVYHFHDPDLLPVGVVLRLMTRQPVIYDSHEDVPRQLLDRVWIPTPLRPLAAAVARLVEGACMLFLSAVISAEPGGMTRLPTRKTVLVQNFPLVEEFPPSPIPYEERSNVVAYVGDLTRARGAEVMVRAMALLPEHLEAKLEIAGKCEVPGLLDELRALDGWTRVHYLGWQSREGVRDLLHRARVGLVVMQPTAQYREATQPVKLFEYMAAGIPVVAPHFPLLDQYVTSIGSGLTVDPLEASAVGAALIWLLTHPSGAEEMGCRGRRSVFERYDWAREAERLCALYGSLTQAPARDDTL